MTLNEILQQLGRGRQVPLKNRVGGGVGDPMDARAIAIQTGAIGVQEVPDALRYVGGIPRMQESYIPEGTVLEYDESLSMSFYSSNVYSAYFTRYGGGRDTEVYDPRGRGNLYILFWKRKGDSPTGELDAKTGPRPYVYENVSEALWQALLQATSKGGLVWDNIRRGGVSGERI